MPKLHKSFPITLTNKKSIKIIITIPLHYFPKIFHVKHFFKYNNHNTYFDHQLRAKLKKNRELLFAPCVIPLKYFMYDIFLNRTTTMRTLINYKNLEV